MKSACVRQYVNTGCRELTMASYGNCIPLSHFIIFIIQIPSCTEWLVYIYMNTMTECTLTKLRIHVNITLGASTILP